MSLVLLNLKSNQQIKLDNESSITIGRGNVTGCVDKRVSRNHLKISCRDGKIHLVALHANPCFFTRNGVPPVHQLLKDEEETLNEGDCVGLLPDAFWFIVTSKIKLEKQDSEASRILEENNVSNIKESIKVEKNFDATKCLASPKPGTSSCVPDSSSESSAKNNVPNIPPELQKTRRLPLWMYECDDPKEIKKSPGKRSLESFDDTTSKKHKVKDIEKEKVENVAPEINKVKTETIDLDLPSTSVITQDDVSETTSTPDEFSLKTCLTEEPSKETGSNTNEIRRPICQYESMCYRQNPNHKQSFSHPGDPDYLPYEDRPLCQYGASCYRTNRIHRVEYRHPPADKSASSSPSSQAGSIGEERPPCLYGSSCKNTNPQHRKDLYHPPKGYTCYFGRSHPSADRDSADDISIASSYEWGTDPRPSFERGRLSDLDDIFSSDEDWMYVGCDEGYYWF